MKRLSERVAIVTGGALGIGGATSRRLAEEGAKVLIADINVDAAQATADEIRSVGGVAETVQVNTGVHEDIRAMIERAEQLWGRLDLLVNNAYGGVPGQVNGTAIDVTEEAWDATMAVLLKSMFLGAKYAVPAMTRAGGGSIVNLSSVHGLVASRERIVYGTGKAAVIGLTRQMACDFGPLGVRVNAVCPGHILTESIAAGWKSNPSGLKFFAAQYPLRRTGEMIDVANGIVFLCSDEASFITGQALTIDGGLTIQMQEELACNMAGYVRENPDLQIPYVTSSYKD